MYEGGVLAAAREVKAYAHSVIESDVEGRVRSGLVEAGTSAEAFVESLLGALTTTLEQQRRELEASVVRPVSGVVQSAVDDAWRSPTAKSGTWSGTQRSPRI